MATKLKDMEEEKMVESVVQEEPVVDLDLDLSATRKKRIRINGDNTKVIELNLSDMLISKRLDTEYKKLKEYMDEVLELSKDPDNSEESILNLADKLSDIDAKMRECIDNIFDYPVCAVCAPDGSMFDPFQGTFRYEHILNALTSYYTTNLNDEYKKLKSNVNNKVAKYTKKK